tara:strand:+ start:112 stop:630 length:519 start_codon:yes stop_codon:yes gene_type:complete
MKKLVSFIALILIATSFSSCKSLNYMKEENLSKVRNIPFLEKDYPNTDKEFYTIQNVRGSNMNINRNRALMAAKTVLANQIQFGIMSIAEQELSFEDSNQREAFNQKSIAISNLSIAKVTLIDSQILKEKEGVNYDYWVVYKIFLDDVVKVINESDLGITTDPTQLLNAIKT